MATANKPQTVFNYLGVTQDVKTIDDKLLEGIRKAYKDMNKTNSEDPLKPLATDLNLVNDPENRDHLSLCVADDDERKIRQNLVNKYLEKKTEENRKARKNKQQIATTTNELATAESVSKVICQIFIKQNHPDVVKFVQSFLLNNSNLTKTDDASVNEQVLQMCVLNVFIQHYLTLRGGVIDFGRPMNKLRLVDPITLVDEFDTWHFDHLHDLFELNLIIPEDKMFPSRWKLAANAQVFYRIQTINNMPNEESTVHNVDRSSTSSLENFVEDVCEKENNGMAAKWIKALRDDDISMFDHLANLKFTEWDKLKTLSGNGKKILKLYVDREKQMTTNTKSEKTNQSKSSLSECELHANLHKIRLYFHYILGKKFPGSDVRTPPKLHVDCINAAFEEMRQDGFADDGLFDQMRMFFLPLTMTETDLVIDEKQWQSMSETRLQEKNQLLEDKNILYEQLNIVENDYYNKEDTIKRLENEMYQKLQNQASNSDATTTATSPFRRFVRRIASGHFIYFGSRPQQEEYEKYSSEELLVARQDEKDALEHIRADLRTRVQIKENMIYNIETSLQRKPHEDTPKTNRDLIKPNRGFIMYGPPGTGKSDIMSTLSVRIGITMVAPPLAAGELNRPLVGESERIISDICMRCHRIPYLMCCISIDEIDSLTSKRNDKSSESNVAKLSVLLSVIDGIKDVPNLMIFCATNRLHMMDEAFLRRMQGKFFVGRPSSSSRKTILNRLKEWHSPLDLLESLTVATTNFSGAALRALCRWITTYCVDAQRKNPNYKLDYHTMLELCDTTARQYRVLIGSETLPTLLLRQANKKLPSKNEKQRFNSLCDGQTKSHYSGKILINFHLNRIDIEILNENPQTGEVKKGVYQEDLLKEETNLQQLVERLTFYGKSRNVQLLQLIDLNLLSLASAYDEKDKFEVLKERFDECDEYRRSMIVYDLDSLVGVSRTEGDSCMGRSTNLSLINQNIYTYIKDQFERANVESRTSNIDVQNSLVTKEKWSVMIIHDEFLVRQFYDDTNFTRCEREIQEEQENHARAEQRIPCVQCNDYYIEDENKMGACMHHDGFVYDNYSSKLTKYKPDDAISRLLKEDSLFANSTASLAEEKEIYEISKQRFRYICCNQTLQTSHTMQGCKKGKHSSTMTRDDWNTICLNSQKYEKKRLTLLQQRT